MSNAEKTVDLLKTGEETILELINLANQTNYEADGVDIHSPRVSADEAYNTDIECTFTPPDSPGNPDPEPVTGELHYNRLDLGRLFEGKNLKIRDNSYENVHDLIPLLTQEVRVLFEDTDIEDGVIADNTYPRVVRFKATPTSLRFTGSFTMELLEAKADDAGFLVAPAAVVGAPSQAALKADGTLVTGQSMPSGAMYVATNNEIEIAASAQIYRTSMAQSPVLADGAYNLNVSDNDDWIIPFSILLKDARNGQRITDLYDVTLNIEAPGGGELNFVLTREYGRLALIDEDNELKLEDQAAYNEGQTLFQSALRVFTYKGKLGGQDVNNVGAPYGTFIVTLTANRKTGAAPDVVVSFDVIVEGIEAE